MGNPTGRMSSSERNHAESIGLLFGSRLAIWATYPIVHLPVDRNLRAIAAQTAADAPHLQQEERMRNPQFPWTTENKKSRTERIIPLKPNPGATREETSTKPIKIGLKPYTGQELAELPRRNADAKLEERASQRPGRLASSFLACATNSLWAS